MTGRVVAIGDIHGCDVALAALLDLVAPVPADTFVVLGDVVDRGPNVRGCIDRLLELGRTSMLVFIQGNHEEMMLDSATEGNWLDDWLGFGGVETLHSYGMPPRFTNVPDAHWEFLRGGLDLFETSRAIFVHANLEPGVPHDQQLPEWLRWQRMRGVEKPHPTGKRVICGHTSLPHGRPGLFDGWVNIDTWCYGGGWLTALDVTTDTVWQARKDGRTQGPLPLEEIAEDYRTRRG